MSDPIDRQAVIDMQNKMKRYIPLDSDRWITPDCLNKIVNLPLCRKENRVKYTIEITLPDNETVKREIKTEPVHWAVWGYSGYSRAQPERVGRWIHDGYDHPHGVDWMHCSECGRREPHVPAAMTDYCPNCGAKMLREGRERR